MRTHHQVHVADARKMEAVDDESVHLVVTSPPYPMIEMWDGLFAELAPESRRAMAGGDGGAAFEAMHGVLDAVWSELARVVVPGGIVAINVGDATRRVGDAFELYPNHVRVSQAMGKLGFASLPDIVWRKPTNSPNKFVGSGMLAPNAYVTLEHEHVLVLRKGRETRAFEPNDPRRYEAAFFWEERNQWFSDVWTDLPGTAQRLGHDALRERSAAFPFALAHRLVNMYSVYGDVVLDPFWGTGTTTLAAMVSARNSAGYELDEAFVDAFRDDVAAVPELSDRVARARLADHVQFVERCHDEGRSLKHTNEHHGFPVMTRQETDLRLYHVTDVSPVEGGFVAGHEPLGPA